MDANITATLNASIVAILSSPATPAQQSLIIEQLVMTALAQQATSDATAVSAAAQVLAQQANVAALAQARPDTAGGLGAQTDVAQAQASTFVPSDPTDDDLLNPPGYAYREFQAAGYASSDAADGPVDRWGSLMASRGGIPRDPAQAKAQFKQGIIDIIATYAAGTANMQNRPSGGSFPGAPVAGATDPYSGAGRTACIARALGGHSQSAETAAEVVGTWALNGSGEAWAATVNACSEADPEWTGALSRIAGGMAVAKSFQGAQQGVDGNVLPAAFTLTQLQAAVVEMQVYMTAGNYVPPVLA